MDRARLAERNRTLAAFQHQATWREHVRRQLLRLSAKVPSAPMRSVIRGSFLLIRPDHLGDLMLTMPAIEALRSSRPTSKMIGLAGAWAADIMSYYPAFNQVLTLPFPGFNRAAQSKDLLAPYHLARRTAEMLRKLHIETAIIFRPDHWWGAMVAQWAGIPVRMGYSHPDTRPFLTQSIPLRSEHTVLQSARLIQPWAGYVAPDKLIYRFPIQDADRQYVAGLLAQANVPTNQPIVVIHPGAGTAIKRWQPSSWAYVADRLADQFKATILFTGSDREHGIIWQIMDKMNQHGISLAGETNVGQLAALYTQSIIVLGPDSGPLHVAVASGAPTVHLFGPADPYQFGPWGNPQRQVVVTSGMACSPCRILDWPGDAPANHPCIHDITPRQVIEAALQAIAAR